MQKRVLGFLLAIMGFGGMALAGYLFVTGSGGRGHLFEVTSYMILGAACFFVGLNYIYESRQVFTSDQLQDNPELDEVSPDPATMAHHPGDQNSQPTSKSCPVSHLI